ncbi:MAG: polysaccharide deacetylase family protein [Acidobacteriota bacterium]
MFWPILIGILIVVALADALGFLFWYACSWPRSQVLGPALVRGPDGKKQIALTFDDGPLPPYTEQILDILQSRKVRATFFVCGKDVEQHPEIVCRIQADGHTIGNHTWSHSYLYFMSRGRIAEEIGHTQRAIYEATGSTPRLFRPPYGGRWFGLYPVLREHGMRLVQWSVNAEDWKHEASAIIASVRDGLRPGAIILLHDGRQKPGGYLQGLVREKARTTNQKEQEPVLPQPEADASETVTALPAIIDAAHVMGYEFVLVEDLFPGRTGVGIRTSEK